MAITEAEPEGLLKQKQQRQPVPVPLDDMIVEIVLRLPVKALLRFRSVSKSWRDLISSRDFVRKHLCLAVNTDVDAANSAFRFLLLRRPCYSPELNPSSCQIIDYQASFPGFTDKG
ncbi:hypothetical protein ACFX2C_037394 [Malus domestica]